MPAGRKRWDPRKGDAAQMKERIEEARDNADLAFWSAIAKAFPEVRTGEFPPDAAFAFIYAQRAALKVWLEWNHPNPKLIKEVYDK